MALIKYTSRLAPTTADGVLVEAKYIKDEGQGKLQSEINADLYEKISNLGSSTINNKGTLEKFSDLPSNPELGDTWIIEEEVSLDGKTYPSGTSWTWTISGEWKPDTTASTDYVNGKLLELKSEFVGKLEETSNNILEEAKTYTDTQIKNYLSWVELGEEENQ